VSTDVKSTFIFFILLKEIFSRVVLLTAGSLGYHVYRWMAVVSLASTWWNG
jgi:hypothetical protein